MNNITSIQVIEPIVFIAKNSSNEELINAYPKMIINENQNQATTKKNLVTELKKHFPEVKFSVKKEYYNCYAISWFEGFTVEEVDSVINKFISYENDCTGDFRDYKPSNFNRLFGGFKYIMTYRNFGDSNKMLLEELSLLMMDEQKDYPNNVSDTLYRLLRKTSFPVGAIITGIKEKENFKGGLIEDSFYITFD